MEEFNISEELMELLHKKGYPSNSSPSRAAVLKWLRRELKVCIIAKPEVDEIFGVVYSPIAYDISLRTKDIPICGGWGLFYDYESAIDEAIEEIVKLNI